MRGERIGGPGSKAYRRLGIDGLDIFYRSAGDEGAPVLLLLHGFPSSSRMFEPLLERMSHRYRLIAPDYPGFGHSDAPPPDAFSYSFDSLAASISGLMDGLGIGRFSLFMQDYGGPVGFRLAMREPERIEAMIVQNANIHQEGLGEKWKGIARYWEDPEANQDQLVTFLSLDAARQRHLGNSPNRERYDPDSWTDEFAFLTRPGQQQIQARLLMDYRTNIASYDQWQQWLRSHKPPLLVLWGRHDLSFTCEGALAYRRDVPEAELHLLDAGHFAMDEQPDEVASLALDFLDRALHARP